MFTGVFKDRKRGGGAAVATHAALASLLQSRNLRPHCFVAHYKIGPFVVAHVCRARSLVVELRPQDGADELRQLGRIAFLNEMGYNVLQISRHELQHNSDRVLARIKAALNS